MENYRKVLILLFTGAIMYTLHVNGIAAESLALYGMEVSGIAGTVVDFILVVGIPAVFNMAQPNEHGESLWRDWWHWVAVGLLVVILLITGLVLVA
jgi:hypothetical protein